ncbi:MAG: hypothetical protein ACJAWL_002472 [Motiliproteus sp.]
MRNTAGFYPPSALFAPRSRQLNQFEHACVRDLAWCLNSPAIYRLGQPDNCLPGETKRLWQWLRRLDQKPQALLDAITRQRSHRLGIYVETLIEFTLAQHLRPERHLYALAVRQQRITLGEYDFLFRRRGEAALRHLEICIKFYLGIPRQQGGTFWIGLNRNDQLIKKRDKMQQRQLQLSQHPAARRQLQKMGEQVGHCHGLMLGRLFYPFAQPTLSPPPGVQKRHLRGWWLRHSEQQQLTETAASTLISSPVLLVSLLGHHWLAPLTPADAERLAAEAQRMPDGIPPGMTARLLQTPQGWREHDRGLLVDDAWLDSVLKTLQ